MNRTSRIDQILQRRMKENNERERNRLIFELVNRRFSEEFEQINSLDAKTYQIIAISGIVLGLETALFSVFLDVLGQGSEYFVIFRCLLIISYIFLIASIVIGLRAYAIKEWETAPNVEHLITEYAMKDRAQDEILIQVTKQLVEAVKKNQKASKKKAADIKISLFALVLGIITYLLIVVVLLFV